MKNYFDHEIKVKYYDNILAKNKNWQWFIDVIEKDFNSFDENIQSWQDFIYSYKSFVDIYSYLIGVSNIDHKTLSFKKKWVEGLYLCASLYNGKIKIETLWEKLDSNYIKLFAIIVFATKLVNKDNKSNYIFFNLLFCQNNIYKIYNINSVINEYCFLKQLLTSVKINGINAVLSCLKNNVNNIEIQPNIELLTQHKKELLSVNSFDHQRITLPDETTWEEQYVFDMVKIKIDQDKIIPLATFNGVDIPNISLWTEDILNNLITYFNNETANYIIETIRLFLYNICPSENTIKLHFDLLIDFLKQKNDDEEFYQIDNSSLLVINKLLHQKMISAKIKKVYMKDFLNQIQKFIDPNTIFMLQSKNTIISETQKDILNKYNNQLSENFKNINQTYELINYFKDIHVIAGLTNEILDEIINKFNIFINNESSVMVSSLFYEFMSFLLSINQNINIEQQKVKNIMIQLQKLWTNEYYYKCINSMTTISGKFEINNEQIESFNLAVQNNSLLFVKYCTPTDTNSLINYIKTSTENPLSLFCTQINITKLFPVYSDLVFKDHDVDKLFLKTIEKIQNENRYKFLNYIEPSKLLKEIYKNYENNISIYTSFLNSPVNLYDKIKNKIVEYRLIDYDGKNLYFAHLLQLFPILENKIREFGACCNIVPFKEKIDEFLHMKDASNVLQQIIIEVVSKTNQFDNIADFFFIYNCMYNGNFLNIRNEASHGRDYMEGRRLCEAFKITLICLDLILLRLESLENK